VTAVMAVLRQNGLLTLASGLTTLVTLGFSVVGHLKDRRASAEKSAIAEAVYRDHLTRAAVAVHGAHEQQRRGALYHYPDITTLLDLALSYSPRVFEKTPLQFDFLCYRLGLGTVPASSRVAWSAEDRAGPETELHALARHLHECSAHLDRMPVTADLRADVPDGTVPQVRGGW
ncbi:MAG TPA: hypothetical protein VGC37_07050, partial [Friedmanniella sp.]